MMRQKLWRILAEQDSEGVYLDAFDETKLKEQVQSTSYTQEELQQYVQAQVAAH